MEKKTYTRADARRRTSVLGAAIQERLTEMCLPQNALVAHLASCECKIKGRNRPPTEPSRGLVSSLLRGEGALANEEALRLMCEFVGLEYVGGGPRFLRDT